MTFFNLFPTINYANVVVTDITRRVALPHSVLRQPTAFAPYTVQAEQRMDLVSYLYYGQDDDEWLITLANQIVDPYYGWYLSDDEFSMFVEKKYNSLPEAMGRISHWATNWASDSRQVTPAYYDALTENLKKYWIPNYGEGATVLSYSRRQEDWTVATNSFLVVNFGAPVPFQVSELGTLYDSGGNLQGTGELASVSGNSIMLKDVQGTWNPGFTLRTSSGSSVVTSIGTRTDFIPVDEVVYFTAVSCFDMEYDKNEENKEVLLIQDSYRGIMYTELATSLNGPVTTIAG